MKILVVDDEDFGRDSLKVVLQSCKHQVEVAADGVEALQTASIFLPDVAIVDWHLGALINGDELTLQLRQNYPDLRIIVVSGQSQIESTVLDQTNAEFLAKPFPLSDLLPLLEK